MLQLAGLLSVALGVVLATIGVQRIIFNEAMADAAARLSFSKKAFVVLGSLQTLAGIGFFASIHAHRGGLRTLSEVAAVLCLLVIAPELVAWSKEAKGRKISLGLLAIAVAALVLLLIRLF